jgi:hypothetical protein
MVELAGCQPVATRGPSFLAEGVKSVPEFDKTFFRADAEVEVGSADPQGVTGSLQVDEGRETSPLALTVESSLR